MTLVLPAVDGENESTVKFTLHSPTVPAALGLHVRKLPDSKYLTRSVNQATHNVDFPPYSNPSTSLRYPQTPTNHISAPIPLSQQTTSNPTQTNTDTSLNGSFRDSDPTSASLQTKVLKHPTLPQSAETWQTVSRRRIRNMDEQEHPKKKNNWLGETITATKRSGTLTEEAAEEASAKHDDNKPPPIFMSGVANIKPLKSNETPT